MMKDLLPSCIVIALSVWMLLFGVKFETKGLKFYINGFLKTYSMDSDDSGL
jgi:hypothetical protein